MSYSITVSMTPIEYPGRGAQYFWHVRKTVGEAIYSVGHGWAGSQEDAWKEAYSYYKEFCEGNDLI